ncbi:MAG: endo-1,4-beta-xylanase [Parcubacteria group bacterium Athens1014_10]|nr:MAG: endo-1,4-beta-xylanase [Parcubacteria group bacterium Athens1014_10]TSD05567.1 MAG: endo-1,4-beta-xylanase [Parcubacteria group bacterium Athens0714_12]
MKKIIVTNSWDDNHPKNLRLLELLNKYNLKATFYLNKNHLYKHSESEIKKIAQNQEIGAHTLTHPDLDKISPENAWQEIKGSKDYFENILGQQVKMFAYPRGFFNQDLKNIVAKAGFLGARTVKTFCLEPPKDFFEFGATLHLYPFPFRKRDARNYHLTRFLFQPLQRSFKGIIKLKLPLDSFFSWQNLAKNLFDYVYRNGGIWHLWGHGFEIEKYDMWGELEDIFKYISHKPEIKYLSNSEVLENENSNFIR